MMRVSIEPKDWMFVKCLDHVNFSATDVIKIASKKSFQKTARETGDLIGNKTSDDITKCLTIR